MSTDLRLADRRVLVTGAGGFLGRHLCRRLQSVGALVHGLGRSSQPDDAAVLRWHQADCTEMSAVRAALDFASPEIIFHLAGRADGRRELELVLPTLHGDLVTAVNVLTAATERGCNRIVLAGSLEEPSPQDPDPNPSSPYAAAKWACTVYARMFHELHQTPVVVGRVFMTYGPAQRACKLIPYVIRCLLQGERPQLAGGERPVDWIYVDDTVDGLLTLAAADGVEGQVLDIGSGQLVTIRQIVEQLAAAVGVDIQPVYGALASRMSEQVRCADVERTFRQTGWRPQVPLVSGLARTIRWFREHAWPITPVEIA